MVAEAEVIHVEVAAAWPELQVMVRVELQAGTTISEAIELSGLTGRFPDLEIRPDRLGVFGEKKRPDHRLRNGDRVEIYRPLKVDPKTARRLAAEAERAAAATR